MTSIVVYGFQEAHRARAPVRKDAPSKRSRITALRRSSSATVTNFGAVIT